MQTLQDNIQHKVLKRHGSIYITVFSIICLSDGRGYKLLYLLVVAGGCLRERDRMHGNQGMEVFEQVRSDWIITGVSIVLLLTFTEVY